MICCEQPRVPGLPGVDDVTDGSVDYYDMDWENVENQAAEEQMQKCYATPCGSTTVCTENSPLQDDAEEYEIISES